jgi:copper chaperone CopZ
MKNLFILLACALPLAMHAQKGVEQLDIKSSTVCDMCVKTITSELIYEKGVKRVTVDLASSTVHVEYDARKNSPEKLRAALVKLGYAADGVPGDPKAFAKLPACCQKEGCGQVPAEK